MSKFYLSLAQRLVRVSDSSGNTFFAKRKKIAADSAAPLPRGNPQILEQIRIGKLVRIILYAKFTIVMFFHPACNAGK